MVIQRTLLILCAVMRLMLFLVPYSEGCGSYSSPTKVALGPGDIKWIASPGFRNWYPHNIKCYWLVYTTTDTSIGYSFQDGFDIEYTWDCTADYVKITDQYRVEKYCGNTRPYSTVSFGPRVTIKFVSDGSISRPGFNISFGENSMIPPGGGSLRPDYADPSVVAGIILGIICGVILLLCLLGLLVCCCFSMCCHKNLNQPGEVMSHSPHHRTPKNHIAPVLPPPYTPYRPPPDYNAPAMRGTPPPQLPHHPEVFVIGGHHMMPPPTPGGGVQPPPTPSPPPAYSSPQSAHQYAAAPQYHDVNILHVP